MAQGIQSREDTSGHRVQPPAIKGNHVILPDTARWSYIFNPVGIWSQLHPL